MSGVWELEASISPTREVIVDGSEQPLVRVQIVDADSPDPAAHAFIDLRSTCALEILAAADDADWQTAQAGCPERSR